MDVFEMRQPGTWLEGIADRDECRETESLVRLLVECVEDAAVSLAFFEAARREDSPSGDERRAIWEEDRAREVAIAAHMEAKLPAELTAEERWRLHDAIRVQASIDAKREAWQTGRVPDSYSHRIPFIHA